MTTQRVVSITGPEGVPLTLPLASVSERLTAFVLDQVIVVVAILILALGLMALGMIAGEGFIALLIVAFFLLRYFYFAVFEGFWHGTTPGKRSLKLRVVAVDGGRLGGDAVLARNLMRELETMIPLAAVLAPTSIVGHTPLWMAVPALGWVAIVTALPFITPNRSRAGDLIGGTAVVRVPTIALLHDQGMHRASVAPVVFASKQMTFYGEHELETLALILRDDESGRVPPEDISVVAQTIAKKIGYVGPEPTFDPRRFLRAFYVQQRAALEDKLVFGKRKKDKFDAG